MWLKSSDLGYLLTCHTYTKGGVACLWFVVFNEIKPDILK